jgi:DNA replication initiation complex subunit (GINS family)
VLTYAELEKALRNERASPTLQKIPSDFYQSARALAESPDIGDYASDVMDFLRRIHRLRANKIIHYAGRAGEETKPPETIIKDELPLYDAIVCAVEKNKNEIFSCDIPGDKQEKKPMMRVRMLKALPEIICSDLAEYGPYRQGDVAELPVDDSERLIREGIAENPGTD